MNRKQRRAATKIRKTSNHSLGDTKAAVQGVDELLGAGLKHHQAGRFAEAEACYRQVLAIQSNHADALHLLGVIAHQVRRYDLAVELIGQAIKANGANPFYYSSLGSALRGQGKVGEAIAAFRQAIVIMPAYAVAHYNLGNALKQQGKLEQAVAAYRQAIEIKPDYAEAHSNLGNALRHQGKLDEAVAAYRHAIGVKPNHAEAHYNLGNALREQGKNGEAVVAYRDAIGIRTDYAEAHCNLGLALKDQGKIDEAIGAYHHAISIKSEYAEAHSNLGNALKQQGNLDEAVAAYRHAIRIEPALAEAHSNLGNALRAQGKLDAALASYERALSLRPDHAETLNNRGIALHELKRFEEALASYDRALSVRPNHPEAFNNRGNALRELRQYDEALASYDRALSVRPDYIEALNNRGIALHELKRFDEAVASYERALSLQPDHAETLNSRGNALRGQGKLEEALASYDRALAANSDHAHAFSGAADCAVKLCDWDRRIRFATDLCAHVAGKKSIVSPFVLLGYSGDPALQLQCARRYIENNPLRPPPFWSGQTWYHDKLRVAYLSSDFRQHATAFLTAGLFEQHNWSRFEVIGISFGVDDRSETRKRLVSAFDEFHDVRKTNDEEVARLLYNRQVDIAIDLMGYTRESRPGILAYRPAPVQVSYLGFPATMGADFIDYVIADAMVLPFEQQQFFTEKIVHLPDCYQVNDSKRKIAESVPARREIGLPEHAFVFCCFNQNWKITPEIFDVWMRLLHQVDGSVLWLFRDNEGAERNLRKEAQRRGIDPSRLVFARGLPLDLHLARYRMADLFLDTLPCNAHTTASDALWVALPVLTCKGEAFAGRVAASLLHAVDMPELITSNLEDYEALALKLARDPAMLAEIRAKLAGHRNTCPLFNTARFTRHIEAAYTTMWETWQRGEAPKSFSVETD